jgi:hypothetical protein
VLTYRYFATAAELLHELCERFDMPAPSQLDKAALENWRNTIRRCVITHAHVACALEMCVCILRVCRSVQLRVVNVIKKWLQQHFYDFGESDE